MLMLNRRPGETIVIGDDIKVVVVSIEGNKVRLGIEAPAAVPVHRLEVYDAIKSEGREVKPGGNLAEQKHDPICIRPGR